MYIYKHQVFTIPQTKRENDSLQIAADLYEPCKHHGILETIISTMAPGRNDYFIGFKGKGPFIAIKLLNYCNKSNCP